MTQRIPLTGVYNGNTLLTINYHWTSTAFSSGSSWIIPFSDGGIGNSKSNTYIVRAVRK